MSSCAANDERSRHVVLTAMDGPSVVARDIPWKMVLRNTGIGTQLHSVSPDTSLFERRPPGRLGTVEEVLSRT